MTTIIHSDIYKGLSPLQRYVVECHLTSKDGRQRDLKKWSLYRMPTTINPSTTVNLIRRNSKGIVQETITVTKDGTTIVPEKFKL